MTLSLLIFWGVVGWCGTPWPRRWPPPPPPPPSPLWIISRVVGAVGGVAGGWLFNAAWPVAGAQEAIASAVLATGFGALFGSFLLQDVLGRLFVGPQPEPPSR